MLREIRGVLLTSLALTFGFVGSIEAQTFNLLMGSHSNDGSSGVHIVNTGTNTATKLWPATGAHHVHMAQFSPDGSQIAFANNDRIVIMGNDGSNPRLITTSVAFTGGFGGTTSFAWTTAGIFWINRNRDSGDRSMSTVCRAISRIWLSRGLLQLRMPLSG